MADEAARSEAAAADDTTGNDTTSVRRTRLGRKKVVDTGTTNKSDRKRVTVGGVANQARSRLASLVWLVAVIAALFVAVGALLIALKANQHNAVVQFVLGVADRIDGPFSRKNGIFTFAGKHAMVKSALVNWGIAAVIYLVIGRILDRIVRP